LDTQKVLVLDDDRDFGQLVYDLAQTHGMDCFITTDSMTFLESVAPSTTLIFLDLVLPHSGGVEVMEKLSRMKCFTPIVLMSGADLGVLETMEEWGKTLGLNVVGYLHKPFHIRDLEAILQSQRVTAPSSSLSDRAGE